MSRSRKARDTFDDSDTRQVQSILSFASEELNTSLRSPRELKSAISNLSQQVRKTNSQRSKTTDLEKQLAEKETQLIEFETKYRELQDVTSKRIGELEAENAQLLSAQTLEIPEPPNDYDNFLLMEEVMHAQTEEIKMLCDQREKIINNIRKQDQLLTKSEDVIRQAQQANEDSMSTISHLREESQSNKILIEQICEELNAMLPNDFPEYQRGEDPKEFVLQTVTSLLQQPKEVEVDFSLATRNAALASQLDAAVRFIQNLANATPEADYDNSPLGLDKSIRTLILTNCARINRFIDENVIDLGDLAENPTVFDASIEDQFQSFLQMATGADLSSSPVRELFALFSAVLEVNKLMANYVDQLKAQVLSNQKSRHVSDEIERLRDENDKLASQLADREDTIRATQDILTIDATVFNIEDMANHVIDILRSLEEQNDILKQDNDRLSETEKLVLPVQQKAAELESQLKSANEDHEADIQELQGQLEEKSTHLRMLEDEMAQKIKELETELAGRKQAIKKAKKEQNETVALIDQIQDRADDLIAEKQDLIARLREYEADNKQLEAQLLDIRDREKKHRDIREALKERAEEAEKQNKETLSDIRRRTEDLREKYDERLEKLQEEASNARKLLNETAQAKNSLVKEKVELMAQVAKLRVSERALKLKVSAMEERNQMEKAAKEARENSYLMSLKTQAGIQIEDWKTELETARLSLIRLLEHQFKSPQKSDQTINGAIKELEEKSHFTITDQKILTDALQLRKMLKLPIGQSLSTAINPPDDGKAEEIRQKLSEAKEELDSLKRNQKQIMADARENGEWERWGQSMYRQITEGGTVNKKDLRFLLEEALLASIGHRQVLRRLEILRTEKKFLRKKEPHQISNRVSLRQMIHSIVFIRRMEVMSGHLPPVLPIAAPSFMTPRSPLAGLTSQ